MSPWFVLAFLGCVVVLYVLVYATRTSFLRYCHRKGWHGPVRIAVEIRRSIVGRMFILWAVLVPLLLAMILLIDGGP